MNVHDFVPPIITRLRVKLQARYGNDAVTYPSYADALRACRGRGYEEAELVRVICEKTKAYRDEVARRPVLSVSSTDAYSLLAAAYCAERRPDAQPTLTIVDFGGACGAHYFTFRKLFARSLRLKWVVVETKAMCAAATELANDELTFRADLDETLAFAGTVDLFHTSGTIQFLEEPYRVLERIASSGAQHLLFNRLALGAGSEDVVTVHRSMLSWNGIGALPAGFQDREVRYPYTLLSRRRFEEKLTGYEEVVEFEDRSGAPVLSHQGVSNTGRLYRLRSNGRSGARS